MAGSPMAACQVAYHCSSERSTARSSGSRSVVRAPARASEPAVGTGSSSAARETFRPMPMTTPGPARSARMPPILRSPVPGVPSGPAAEEESPGAVTRMSLGHLREVSIPAAFERAVAVATPVSSGSQPQRAVGTRGVR